MIMFFCNIRDVLFGENASLEIGTKLKELGVTSALCMYDKGVKAAGITDKIIGVIESEGIRTVSIDDVQMDPSIELIDSMAQTGRAAQVNAVVAIGGGSSIDAAKTVNLLLTNPGSAEDYITKAPENPVHPLFLIPTTAGTGSECSDLAVVSDLKNKTKVAIKSVYMRATLAIVDPVLTWGLPKAITAYTGMDALTHCVEGYTSKYRNQMIDVLNREGIRLAWENLPVAVANPGDKTARSNMCFSSMLGGISLPIAPIHLGHTIAHYLGAFFYIPHGIACAVLIPGVIEQLAIHGDEDICARIREIGGFMGLDTGLKDAEIGYAVGAALREMNKTIGIPLLSGYVESLDQLLSVVPSVIEDPDGTLNFAPIAITPAIVSNILEKEYKVGS